MIASDSNGNFPPADGEILTFKSFLPLLFIFVLTLAMFFPVLIKGKTFYAFDTLYLSLPWSSSLPGVAVNNTLITDPVNAHFPLHRLIHDSIRQRKLPLWDESLFCGIPLSPGTYSRYLNPFIFFVFALFPLPLAHDVLLWIHLLGTGTMMFLYLKELGLHRQPALIGAVAWMFNGYVVVWFEFEVIQILSLSLPAMLYFIEVWMKRRTFSSLLLAAAAGAVAVSSGFAHVLIYQFLFVGSYIIFRWFSRSTSFMSPRRLKRKDLLAIGSAAFLGLLLSSDFLISHCTLTKDVQRHGYSFGELYRETGQLPAEYIATLFYPDLFGNPVLPATFTPKVKGTQPYNNYNELCIYAGIFTLFLSTACIPCLLKMPNVTFYGLACIVSLSMAMGSILYYPLAAYFPGLNLSTPTRVLYIFGFTLSVLAAFGAQFLLTGPEGKKWSIFSLEMLLFFAGLGLFYYLQTRTGIRWATAHLGPVDAKPSFSVFLYHFSTYSPVLIRPMLFIGLSYLCITLVLFSNSRLQKEFFLFIGLCILSFDLISFSKAYNSAVDRSLAYPKTDAIRFLEDDPTPFRIATTGDFLQNVLSPFGLQDIGGYSSLYPRRYGQYFFISQYGTNIPLPDRFSRWITLQRFGSPMFDLLNAKYLLVSAKIDLKVPFLELVFDKEIRIYRNQNVFPRIFVVSDYRIYKNENEILAALHASSREDLRKCVFLESEPPEPVHFAAKNPGAPATINVIDYSDDRIEIEVSSETDGFVVISDSYYPEWEAYVDGKSRPILRGNYIMRAIQIRSGTHTVQLYYRPKALISGIIFTAVGWGTAFLSIIFAAGFEQRTTGGRDFHKARSPDSPHELNRWIRYINRREDEK